MQRRAQQHARAPPLPHLEPQVVAAAHPPQLLVVPSPLPHEDGNASRRFDHEPAKAVGPAVLLRVDVERGQPLAQADGLDLAAQREQRLAVRAVDARDEFGQLLLGLLDLRDALRHLLGAAPRFYVKRTSVGLAAADASCERCTGHPLYEVAQLGALPLEGLPLASLPLGRLLQHTAQQEPLALLEGVGRDGVQRHRAAQDSLVLARAEAAAESKEAAARTQHSSHPRLTVSSRAVRPCSPTAPTTWQHQP
eukprot:6004905-Prymnesium_polylepis.1